VWPGSGGPWLRQLAYNAVMPLGSSDRFLGRVEGYAKYRPGYPDRPA